jgi:protein-S-isoprenylcysteine O-methyltransferase Ste14
MFILRLTWAVLLEIAIFGSLLFIPAGTLDWWRAWAFIGLVFVGAAATTFFLFREHPDLLTERLKFPIQRGQPLADKIVMPLIIVAFAGLVAFIPLDVFRFRLIPQPGIFISSLGLVLLVVGWWLAILALHENRFAIAAVRHQTERYQAVIDTGVYGVVRHPMYAGAALFFVGMTLWLESYAAALLAIVPIAVLAVRILVEEHMLRRELKGYDGYTRRVRYRLIPFVW